MGGLEVEKTTIGWAARDPSGLLSPYTYTLRYVTLVLSIIVVFASPQLHSYNNYSTNFKMSYEPCFFFKSCPETQDLKMWKSKFCIVGSATLIFTKLKMILACPTTLWFLGICSSLSIFPVFSLSLYIYIKDNLRVQVLWTK